MSIAINDIAIPTPLIYPAPVGPVWRPKPGHNDLRRRGGLKVADFNSADGGRETGHKPRTSRSLSFNDYYMHAGGGAAVEAPRHSQAVSGTQSGDDVPVRSPGNELGSTPYRQHLNRISPTGRRQTEQGLQGTRLTKRQSEDCAGEESPAHKAAGAGSRKGRAYSRAKPHRRLLNNAYYGCGGRGRRRYSPLTPVADTASVVHHKRLGNKAMPGDRLAGTHTTKPGATECHSKAPGARLDVRI